MVGGIRFPASELLDASVDLPGPEIAVVVGCANQQTIGRRVESPDPAALGLLSDPSDLKRGQIRCDKGARRRIRIGGSARWRLAGCWRTHSFAGCLLDGAVGCDRLWR
jgi:hypothetical protein